MKRSETIPRTKTPFIGNDDKPYTPPSWVEYPPDWCHVCEDFHDDDGRHEVKA